MKAAEEPTWRGVLQQLEAEGLLGEMARAAVAERVATEEDQEADPWYLRLLVGAGAWLAAVLFLIFVFGTQLIRSEEGATVFGLGLVVAATAAQRRVRPLFARQFVFALSLAGQISFAVGLLAWTDGAAAWLAIALLEGLLVWVYPDPVHRFMATVASVLSVVALVHALDALDLVHLVTLLGAAGAWVLWAREGRLLQGAYAGYLRPVGYGLVVALLGLLLLSTTPTGVEGASWWLSTVALGCVLLYAAHGILAAYGLSTKSGAALVAFGGIVACCLLTLPAPGVVAALFVLVLGFYRGDRLLMGLAVCFLVVFLFFLYYNLELTLLAKSVVLAGSGGLLLGLRLLLTRFVWRDADAADGA